MPLRVIFKNVGQGDSIAIEWGEKDFEKIGIVDCNIVNNSNPLLDYLKTKEISEIDFIIISHPHFDHFSGMRMILEYCESKKIKINRLYHTINNYQLIETYVFKSAARNELNQLLRKIDSLLNKLIVDFGFIQDTTKDINLNNTYTLSFLSPCGADYLKYIKHLSSSKKIINNIYLSNNPSGNILSSILCIHSNDKYLLLTSDATVSALKRIGINNTILKTKKFLLSQVPHHGSRKNHLYSFWEKRNYANKEVIFSTGDNIYHHPDYDVVEYFYSKNYKIFSTNFTCGLKDFYLNTPAKKSYSNLELIGKKLSSASFLNDPKLSGDKIFEYS